MRVSPAGLPGGRVAAFEAVAVALEVHRGNATLNYRGVLARELTAEDAEIYRSQPGLGPILGARVLGEFGDDPNRYQDGRARKNYAGTSPITQASGRTKVVSDGTLEPPLPPPS